MTDQLLFDEPPGMTAERAMNLVRDVSVDRLRRRIERQAAALLREHAWRKRAETALRVCHAAIPELRTVIEHALSTDLLRPEP